MKLELRRFIFMVIPFSPLRHQQTIFYHLMAPETIGKVFVFLRRFRFIQA